MEIAMHKITHLIKSTALVAGLLALQPVTTTAASYSDSFPSGGSTVVASVGVIDADELGYFWSMTRGDLISQTFVGTGLATATTLDLSVEVSFNVLAGGNQVDWGIFVNAVQVGTWTVLNTDGTFSENLSYVFAPIAGAGTYTISMEVLNEVPSGAGSIALRYPGRMTITDEDGGRVPDGGATAGMLALGAIGLAALRNRKSA